MRQVGKKPVWLNEAHAISFDPINTSGDVNRGITECPGGDRSGIKNHIPASEGEYGHCEPKVEISVE